MEMTNEFRPPCRDFIRFAEICSALPRFAPLCRNLGSDAEISSAMPKFNGHLFLETGARYAS